MTSDSSSRSPRAVLIERDPDYTAVIKACLHSAGCEADHVQTVRQALSRIGRHSYDVVVWGVSHDEDGRNGYVEELRAAAHSPIIVIDESTTEARQSFEAGADQFLPKPFVPGALVGAVKAALRTVGPTSAVSVASRIEIAGAVFDADDRRITAASGDDAILTKREWELFAFLLGHSNRYFTAGDLIRQAWGTTEVADEQLRTYIAKIRRKTDGLDLPCHLESRQGLGYRLALSDDLVP